MPPNHVGFIFDDGPNIHADTTARLLDVLGKYQIKAFFCLLGENVERFPELTKRIHDEGHIIINHGYSDKWARRMERDEFLDNLLKGEAAITAAIGAEIPHKIYQPHGGFYIREQEMIIKNAGYTMVPGTIRVYDAVNSGKYKQRITRQVIKKTIKHNGGILLLHDSRDSHKRMETKLKNKPDCAYNRSWIPDAVEEIIIVLTNKGYGFNISTLYY